jgi:glyoxylase-like metal-dependent hydrolase (beta-lactamase superfamily II)
VWIDTGWNRPGEAQARIDYWHKLGSPRLAGIVVTHRHPPHWGNAPAIQRVSGAPIIATAAEKAAIEERMTGARVDRVVEDGETLGLGDLTLEFVHAPGHTYGSLGVFGRESRALFTGDNVMGTGTSVINPGEGEIGLFLRTMEKFMRYDPAVIYPGQGPAVAAPRAKLAALIRHRHEREAQIVGLLAGGPRSVDDLFGSLYAGLDERLGHLARNQIRSHLIELERQGRVAASGETYRLLGAGATIDPDGSIVRSGWERREDRSPPAGA